MKKLFYIPLALLICTAFYLYIFTPYDPFERELRKFIRSEASSIPVRELTNFDWDAVCREDAYNEDSSKYIWQLSFYRNDILVDSIQFDANEYGPGLNNYRHYIDLEKRHWCVGKEAASLLKEHTDKHPAPVEIYLKEPSPQEK